TTEISSGTSAGRDTGGGGASVRNQSRQTWTRAEMPSPIHTLRLERCSCVTRFPQARMAPRSGATSENAQEPENAKPDSAPRLAGRPAGQPQRQRLRGHGTGPAPSPRQQNADGARAPYLEASQVTWPAPPLHRQAAVDVEGAPVEVVALEGEADAEPQVLG